MFTGSIKISELDALTFLVDADFFPLVQSGSLTTYRVNLTTLNNWFRVSGSCLSASWASRSLDSAQATSASWASASLTANQSISSSWASASISSSFANSASYSEQASTSSFALVAISASFAPFTQSFQASGSWASQSLSSSYAVSASYAPVLGDTVPIGTITAFGGVTVPNNWLECDGAAYLTSSFPELYSAISSSDASASYGYLCDSFGNRNSSEGYFKIPDFRGEFLRGWDHNRGVDLNRVFASLQLDAFKSHTHTFNQYGGNGVSAGSVAGTPPQNSLGLNPGTNLFTTNATGDNDTRPRNIAILWCIKYSNSVNFATTGSATVAGDVVGTISNTTVIKLRNIPITSSTPGDGDILLYDSASNIWYGGQPNIGGAPGKSYWSANPGFIFPNGDDIYVYNYSSLTGRRNLVHINQATNVVTYKQQWPQDTWAMYGRIFRKTTDNALHIITYSDVDLYDYDIDADIVTRITGSGGYADDLPVKVSWTSGSLRPTTWALYGSYYAGTYGDVPSMRWRKHWWNGTSWQHDLASNTVNLLNVNNSTEFRKFLNYSTNPAGVHNALLWDYNPIKKRYYLIESSTGYLHIFSQDSGDIDTAWNETSMSYVKTLAVPVSSMDTWTDASSERFVVDYHPDTGEERGICHTRRSNFNLVGVAAYIYWPEVT